MDKKKFCNNRITQSITDQSDLSVKLFLKDIRKFPELTADEEAELVRKMKKGDKNARKKLIECNLRFVVSIAKKYQYKGLSLTDLIQEGCIGLMTALDTFDDTKGFRFISYAVWRIKHDIICALCLQSRTIRPSIAMINILNKINNATKELEQKKFEQVQIGDIAHTLDMNEEELIKALNATARAIYVEDDNGDKNKKTLIETLPDKTIKPVSYDIEQQELIHVLHEAIEHLPNLKRKVIRMYFGFDGRRKSISTIARELKMSTPFIHFVYNDAIRNLRGMSTLRETYMS